MRPIILVADAHVGESRENAAAFFEMLAGLEATRCDLVFLGDIFDLWIGLAGYETAAHRHFSAWCRRQKAQRSIGFMEGNHEFFIARQQRAAFTWCTADACWQQGGILYVHGDRINRRDISHRLFRAVTRSRLAGELLRRAPNGPRMAMGVKTLLARNRPSLRALPLDEIRRFAESWLERGVHTILVGHFHAEYVYRRSGSGSLHLLPGWQESRKITRVDPLGGTVASGHWREVCDQLGIR
jgi:UDP-2,3-diacylglucosamine pyrophosphatase LpxH